MKFTDPFGTDTLRSRIYVVSDQGRVLYVGLAKHSSVGQRLAMHLENSVSSRKRSRFANLLRENHPTYLDWRIDAWSVTECSALVGRTLPSLEAAEQAIYDFYARRDGIHPVGNSSRPSGRPRKRKAAEAYSLAQAER